MDLQIFRQFPLFQIFILTQITNTLIHDHHLAKYYALRMIVLLTFKDNILKIESR